MTTPYSPGSWATLLFGYAHTLDESLFYETQTHDMVGVYHGLVTLVVLLTRSFYRIR